MLCQELYAIMNIISDEFNMKRSHEEILKFHIIWTFEQNIKFFKIIDKIITSANEFPVRFSQNPKTYRIELIDYEYLDQI